MYCPSLSPQLCLLLRSVVPTYLQHRRAAHMAPACPRPRRTRGPGQLAALTSPRNRGGKGPLELITHFARAPLFASCKRCRCSRSRQAERRRATLAMQPRAAGDNGCVSRSAGITRQEQVAFFCAPASSVHESNAPNAKRAQQAESRAKGVPCSRAQLHSLSRRCRGPRSGPTSPTSPLPLPASLAGGGERGGPCAHTMPRHRARAAQRPLRFPPPPLLPSRAR